jgi:hypothetical protein
MLKQNPFQPFGILREKFEDTKWVIEKGQMPQK